LRDYQQGSEQVLTLGDLIQFVDAFDRADLTMIDTAAHREDPQAVRLMTTHKAKGQEFDTVFLIGLENDIWRKLGGNRQRFSYPQNLSEIKPSENDSDDALRLLFVAMTRARQNLHMCYFTRTEDGKAQQPFAPLLAMELEADTPEAPTSAQALATQYEQRWLNRHAGVEQADKHALLADKLERYQLSATHFNNYLDVTRGGPLYFLTQNLLRFPSSTSPQASYGVVVHAVLRSAHEQVASGQPPSVEQLLTLFRTKFLKEPLTEHDRAQLTVRGEEHLRHFFAHALPTFRADQRAEVDFRMQGITLDGARLTGSLDLMDFDKTNHTITVTDYKTGKPFSKWDIPPSSAEHDRVKLHRYRRQLLFYKLLVDGSNDWGQRGWHTEQGILRFVEPDPYGKLRDLAIDYDPEELERTKLLIVAVWKRIMALDFPDISQTYTPDLTGSVKFENDLLANG
jgi:DNA helicase-2/ATP-dependent DNA helicase PcrA